MQENYIFSSVLFLVSDLGIHSSRIRAAAGGCCNQVLRCSLLSKRQISLCHFLAENQLLIPEQSQSKAVVFFSLASTAITICTLLTMLSNHLPLILYSIHIKKIVFLVCQPILIGRTRSFCKYVYSPPLFLLRDTQPFLSLSKSTLRSFSIIFFSPHHRKSTLVFFLYTLHLIILFSPKSVKSLEVVYIFIFVLVFVLCILVATYFK